MYDVVGVGMLLNVMTECSTLTYYTQHHVSSSKQLENIALDAAASSAMFQEPVPRAPGTPAPGGSSRPSLEQVSWARPIGRAHAYC